MKIVIGGSMSFAKEQLKAKEYLENKGYEVLVTDDIESYAVDTGIKASFDEELKISLEYDIMRTFFKKIEESDAFLVMNFDKGGTKGYLGVSVLMELGLAYYLNKKIYLLNEIDKEQPYALEVEIIKPERLKGSLENIEVKNEA